MSDGNENKGVLISFANLIVGLLNQVPGINCLVPGGAFYAWPNVTEACRMTDGAYILRIKSVLLLLRLWFRL